MRAPFKPFAPSLDTFRPVFISSYQHKVKRTHNGAVAFRMKCLDISHICRIDYFYIIVDDCFLWKFCPYFGNLTVSPGCDIINLSPWLSGAFASACSFVFQHSTTKSINATVDGWQKNNRRLYQSVGMREYERGGFGSEARISFNLNRGKFTLLKDCLNF